MQSSGKLNSVKHKQFHERVVSKRLRRRQAIKRSEWRENREYLRKIGKLDETVKYKTNRRS